MSNLEVEWVEEEKSRILYLNLGCRSMVIIKPFIFCVGKKQYFLMLLESENDNVGVKD